MPERAPRAGIAPTAPPVAGWRRAALHSEAGRRRPGRRASARVLAAILGCGAVAAAATGTGAEPAPGSPVERKTLPWAAAGLTERQAAAHLLDRFAFGPRPGDIDRLLAQGLEEWLEAQLTGTAGDSRLVERVRSLDAWSMPASEIARTFPPPALVRREAMNAGLADRSMAAPQPGEPPRRGVAEDRRAILELYAERGWRAQGELLGQLVDGKLIQAAHSERQLQAVLEDFWFNHFNVSLTDPQARAFLLSYQRDAIAPGVLGRFHDLLAEVAAHPAMLVYLDNAQSTAGRGAATTLDQRPPTAGRATGMPPRRPPPNRSRGLNENFARELLELHTLGVDGGYTQEDVIAVARAFTGWSVLPPDRDMARQASDRQRRAGMAGQAAPVVRGGFVFNPAAHDAGPKTVLGTKLPGGRGIEDGLDVLDLVAHHPSTARHLARKIAVRFVSDQPPPALVERLAATFLATRGDLREVMRELLYSPELWSAETRGQKIKSPFELAVSAVRALGGEVSASATRAGGWPPRQRPGSGPTGLAQWIARMGQPLYACQAPTGYPDRAEAWVSTGALLTRMSFGLHLATGRVAGVGLDVAELAAHREPESLEQALALYASLMLPERDLVKTVRRLEALVRAPELGGRVERAAGAVEDPGDNPLGAENAAADSGEGSTVVKSDGDPMRMAAAAAGSTPAAGELDRLEQVVGVIIGSPEFQRR